MHIVLTQVIGVFTFAVSSYLTRLERGLGNNLLLRQSIYARPSLCSACTLRVSLHSPRLRLYRLPVQPRFRSLSVEPRPRLRQSIPDTKHAFQA